MRGEKDPILKITQRDFSEEVCIVDPLTGGEKGQKLQRFSLIPPQFLWELAEHYGRGAFKYADRNWERGYKWSLSYDASQRHLHQWINGESNDTETGSNHLVAAVWHLIALWFYEKYEKGTDDIRIVKEHPASPPEVECTCDVGLPQTGHQGYKYANGKIEHVSRNTSAKFPDHEDSCPLRF